MSAVIDMRTRKPREVAAEPEVICLDDEHVHTRFRRLVNSTLLDAEQHGIPWPVIRQWLVGALQYVDAKIALGGVKS